MTFPQLPNLHHVGIVQPDIKAAEQFMSLFEYEEDYRGYVEPFECWCIFLKAAQNSPPLELVVPTGGSLARFNKGAGGIHHYALITEDIVKLQQEFSERGISMTHPEPVQGAGNFLCNFVSPIATRGIMVEYVQLLA
ncbi:VOC family protein [Blastopirellula marina]|uniref:4-hydroxyphenylpyruvate dioxygenase n=1 Tax=Blastopirellula marina TaxID=124 RepID=A0A2S8GTX8_9BACT|nr:VOC family protein [Blastopirellula marina]PQO47862.1 4-hydroxyphenylpyruvate dioxygenase [Blastopirellula marina]